ncbi:MAG: CDP-diacylglycerol--glycerol-3-phosphate 3-phosphatidyltransferase [Phycisphaeraceae bacterium]
MNYRQIPNQLTVLRLFLAAVFFLVLNRYRYPVSAEWPLVVATILFILAAITDTLDGYYARKWQVESTFGRIMDPFCDKVLVIGAFIYLAGPRFVDPEAVEQGHFFTMISGVYPWMVAVILARELLVTGIRGELEGQGVQFGAGPAGKLKMILQSVAVPVVLLIVLIDPRGDGWRWLSWVRDAIVYLTVFVTVVSGIPYVFRAASSMAAAGEEK